MSVKEKRVAEILLMKWVPIEETRSREVEKGDVGGARSWIPFTRNVGLWSSHQPWSSSRQTSPWTSTFHLTIFPPFFHPFFQDCRTTWSNSANQKSAESKATWSDKIKTTVPPICSSKHTPKETSMTDISVHIRPHPIMLMKLVLISANNCRNHYHFV